MKKIIIVILLLFVCSGCTRGKTEDNVVNVLNWSSYIPDEVIRDFENETGIKVNYSTYSSNEELLAKVSSSSAGTYDLVFPSDYMVEVMKERNLLKKIDKNKLTNVDNLDSRYMNQYFDVGNEYSLPFLLTVPVIAYDSTKINFDINSYNDLLNSKLKNDIVILDDQRIIIGMALLSLGYDMNETDEYKLKEAEEWLLKLKSNIKAFDSDSPKSFLITGEVSVAFLWNAEAAISIIENENIKVVFPIEGVAKSMDNFALLNGIKHEKEAYMFIDYILKGDVMKKIIESYPYINLNTETSKILSNNYLNNIASNVSYDVINNGFYVKNIGESIRRYDEIWTAIK